ncbi:hypothetical protein K3G63_10455 [Hymenobacter sp. HSC-4F20]|uniref:hypothetical protein n=1 Tax=Hymenobacter sp. HSC-4F20 TaxID=2864135 RepID=UPI001C734F06|nr:hypothetical protein [Hymenobacter sp. HSC-4F20]MBX0290862.1 hypothetical protein [Hymenobacter sp. HSC-4F20]
MPAAPAPDPRLPEIRAYYGLSQLELSELLGVSRALVALTETGQRKLPAAAAQALHPLVAAMSAAASAGAAVPAPDWGPLQAYQQQCQAQAATLRRELARMQQKAVQYQHRLQVLPTLHASLPVASEEHAQAWVAQLLEEARQQWQRNGPGAQALLTVRIKALEYEAAEALRELAMAGAWALTKS